MFAEPAYVAAGGADLDIAVDRALVAEKLERLSGHLQLLFFQRWNRISQIREKGLYRWKLLLEPSIDLFVVVHRPAGLFDQRMKSIFGIEVKDVLQETIKSIVCLHVRIHAMKFALARRRRQKSR